MTPTLTPLLILLLAISYLLMVYIVFAGIQHVASRREHITK